MRRFYNYTATISVPGVQEIKGSLVESKTILYTDISIALWKKTKSYQESTLATQTDTNEFEINLKPQYPISVGFIVETKLGIFKVDQVIEHHNSRGRLENIQAFISTTT